jgi:hypothetical protein
MHCRPQCCSPCSDRQHRSAPRSSPTKAVLDDRGVPASGRYDIRLVVYRDAESGAAMAAPLDFPSVDVVEGKFRLQFDAPLEGSAPAWVELAVRDPGAKSFSVIPARTKAVLAPAVIGACWSSTGDAGSNPSVNFLGTTDAQPLVFRTGDAQSLRIEPSSISFNGKPINANVIAGSSANSVDAGVRGATIAGGGAPIGGDPSIFDAGPHRVTDTYGTVGGGSRNQAGDGAGTLLDQAFATVGGGRSNAAKGFGSTVGGGETNQATGDYSTVGGGDGNSAGFEATVGGGQVNQAFGASSTIVGGNFNTTGGSYATVGGGEDNCAGGNYSWAGGRQARVRPAAAIGLSTCNSFGSYPGGTGDAGTFIWADSQNAGFESTGDDQFMIRAQGGVAINSAPTATGVELSVYGTTASAGFANIFLRQLEADRGGVLMSAGGATANGNNAGLYFDQYRPSTGGQDRRMELDTNGRLRVYVDGPIKPTSGSWSAPSDARLKHHVAPLHGSLDRLLALRGVTFEYNPDAPSNYFVPGVHAGFVAQDVERVFPEWVSTDEDGYRLVGPQGFEALAVEALRELRDTNRELREEVAELRARLDSQGTAER